MVSAIPPIGGIGQLGGAAAAGAANRPPAAGFGDALGKGLAQVSGLESTADALTQSVATGGPTQIHELMVATTKAQLGVEMLSQVRNRAVEAYQEIMRLPV
jgi:flagellar hook-basal body complex protein FliE